MRYYKHSTWQDSNGKEQTDITFYIGEYEDVLPGNDPKYNRVERTRINDHVMHIRTSTHLGTEDDNIEFFHKDHLGSIEAITDIKGNLLQQMSFDAFGARRKTNWAGELTEAETDTLLSEIGIGTSRGYTGHEHLDRTGLIHMNGRVYDPTLGRFLSADPIVQAPYFSQSYNRYTYVWNNPLGMNDPSGYEGNDSLGEDDKEAPPELVTVETVDKDGNKFDIVMTVSRAKELGAMDDEGKAIEDAPLTVSSKSGKKKGGLVGVSSGHAAGKAQKDNATSQQQGGDTAGVERGGGSEHKEPSGMDLVNGNKVASGLISTGAGVLAIAACAIAEPCGGIVLVGAIAGGVATVLGLNTYADGMTGVNPIVEGLDQGLGVSPEISIQVLNTVDTATVLINPVRKGANSLLQRAGPKMMDSKVDNYVDMLFLGNNVLQHKDSM